MSQSKVREYDAEYFINNDFIIGVIGKANHFAYKIKEVTLDDATLKIKLINQKNKGHNVMRLLANCLTYTPMGYIIFMKKR